MTQPKKRATPILSTLLSVLLVLFLSPGTALAAEGGEGQNGTFGAEPAASAWSQETQTGAASSEELDASADADDAATGAVAGQAKNSAASQRGDAAQDGTATRDGGDAKLADSGKIALVVQDAVFNLGNNSYVEVDGNAIKATQADGGVSIAIDKPVNGEEPARFLTYYLYNKAFSPDADYDYHNSSYPTSMYVWELVYDSKAETYSAVRLDAFNDILKYAGCAVRTSSSKGQGIRLVTSMPSDQRAALIDSSLEGYSLVETGTLVQWDSSLDGDSLTESATSMKGRAYIRANGVDPIYKSGNGVIKYTNVLTGFSDDKCKPLLSLRPYMKVTKDGKEYCLYGGTVHRSIGYIASQNTSEFGKGTAGYKFIWNAVHAAYGSSLDSQLGYVDWDIRAHVTCWNQMPELPWGCESLALTNTLNGFGFSLNKTEIYDNYLSHSSWDFVHAYAGDAYNEIGIGMCMPPAITDAANRYLVTHGVRERAYNITGSDFENVLSYVDQGYPVIVWITSFMDPPNFFGSYIEGYRAYTLVHCVSIIGHDGYNDVTISCSGSGCAVSHDYSTFASIFSQCGNCAVVIL